MQVHVTYEGLTAYGTTQYRVPVGKSIRVELTDAPHKMLWFAHNDEVLAIYEAQDGLSANILCTSVGSSQIQLQGRGGHIDEVLTVTVYQPGTVRVNATFTNIRLK